MSGRITLQKIIETNQKPMLIAGYWIGVTEK